MNIVEKYGRKHRILGVSAFVGERKGDHGCHVSNTHIINISDVSLNFTSLNTFRKSNFPESCIRLIL
jgi:hypothetical protein